MILLDSIPYFSYQQRELFSFQRHLLKPKPKLTGLEYANSTFKLSPESSSEAGQVTLYPYQEEIINCMTDQHTEFVTVKKSARVGYSIMLNITVAYFIENDPCSILFAQPSDDEAYGYATDSIEPMIRDNKGVLSAISTKPLSGKVKKEKTVKKLYAGGILEVVGAHSPKNFRRRTVRIAIADEINGWAIGAGDEGDQIKLMTKRTNDFYNRKVIIGSSTTIVGKSRISKEHKLGDMRYRMLPCLECGHSHKLEIQNLKYDLDDGYVVQDSVGFGCPECGSIFNQSHHRDMDTKGLWKADKKFRGHASFHVWAAYSYSAKSSWYHIAKEYEEAKTDPIKMQVFVNTVLGEDYEDKQNTLTPNHLMKKREEYDIQVPMQVRVLTMGADTQNDRVEWAITGWGEGHQQWVIDRGIIYGDPSQDAVWDELDDIKDNREFIHPKGKMKVFALGVDAGGSRTSHVYAYTNPRLHKRVYALKGANTTTAPEITRRVHKDPNHKYHGITYFMVGVHTIKDIIWTGLSMETPKAWFIHFPKGDMFLRDYFEQLTAEYKNDKGRWETKVKGARNEAFDILVYNYATLRITGVDVNLLARDNRYIMGSLKAKKQKQMMELSGGI